MTDVRAAPELERLPWLTDEKAPTVGAERGLLLGWALAAVVLVAGTSFWLGMNSTQVPSWDDFLGTAAPEATVRLPEPIPAEPLLADPTPMPQVEPVAEHAPVVITKVEEVRPARRSAPARKRRILRREPVPDTSLREVVENQAKLSTRAKAATAYKPWTSWESAGAEGRMVRIGTYPTRHQAKVAWRKLVKIYPGMRRLRAVTTDIPSLRNGRTYYRLQFGTTSQAHSEVLCQRMRTIGQSCVVVDLAGARSRNRDDGQPIGL